MNNLSRTLDRHAVTPALRRLGDRLAWRGIVADLYVFEGTAMAIAYDIRRSTRRLDNLLKPQSVVTTEAGAVAVELGLPAWWLDQHANVYVSTDTDPRAPVIFDHPGLRVHSGCPVHLLAMKVMASSRRDAEDIRQLIAHLALSSVDDVLAKLRLVFPDEAIPERAIMMIEEALP